MKLVRTSDDGVELLCYVYEPDMPEFEGRKPYAHPIRTLAGDVVTGYRPHDHRWHKGLQMTVSHLSGQNFWGGGTYVRGRGYVDLANVGSVRHVEFGERSAERVSERLAWHTHGGEQWVDEARELTMRIAGTETAWELGLATALTNVRDEPLAFGSPTTNGRPQAGYCGLFWRGPRCFTDGEVLPDGPEMMGRSAPWLAFVGRHDEVDRSSTLIFVDDPRWPGRWFVRSTPFAAVNPSLAFHHEVRLAPGDTLRRSYRVVIADGAWDRDRIESYLKEHPW